MYSSCYNVRNDCFNMIYQSSVNWMPIHHECPIYLQNKHFRSGLPENIYLLSRSTFHTMFTRYRLLGDNPRRTPALGYKAGPSPLSAPSHWPTPVTCNHRKPEHTYTMMLAWWWVCGPIICLQLSMWFLYASNITLSGRPTCAMI